MLMIVSVLVLLMGVLALLPSLEMATEPMWHAVVKIIVGIAGLAVAMMDKKKMVA